LEFQQDTKDQCGTQKMDSVPNINILIIIKIGIRPQNLKQKIPGKILDYLN